MYYSCSSHREKLRSLYDQLNYILTEFLSFNFFHFHKKFQVNFLSPKNIVKWKFE